MDKNKLREEFRKRVERFELAHKLFPDDPEKIAAISGMEYHEDGCTGCCDDCEQRNSCEVYKEIIEDEQGA